MMTKLNSDIFKPYFNKVYNADDSLYVIYDCCDQNFKFKEEKRYKNIFKKKYPTQTSKYVDESNINFWIPYFSHFLFFC